MEVKIKTYNIPEGKLDFEFYYDSALTGMSDYDIIDLSPLSYGYDSADPREISIYPSNISIVIDDFTGDNYSNFKTLYLSYDESYPFNFYGVFYILIKLNNSIMFSGILDELESNNEDKTLTLTFVDGINKYKDVEINNPYLLYHLRQIGLIPSVYVTLGLQRIAQAFGFGSIYYKTTSTVGEIVLTPGYMISNLSSGDADKRLSSVIIEMCQLLKQDMIIEYNNEYKYGDIDTAIEDMVTIDYLNVRRIMSSLIGRYVAIHKIDGRENQIGDSSHVPDYAKPDKFNLVFEDETYKVYYHNYSGTVGSLKFEKGIDEKKISDILKILAKNTFSYFGLKDFNTFFFRHKRFVSSPTELTSIISMSKILTVDRINIVKINDYYEDNYGQDGENTGDKKIEYKIPLNAFPTDNGYEYRLNYYSGSTENRVVHFYDSQINYKDFPQEVISRAEWEAHKNFRDQYEFELSGIDYEFDRTYSVDYENYTGMFRPITIEKNLLESKTKMTALEIG